MFGRDGDAAAELGGGMTIDLADSRALKEAAG